MSGKRQDFDSYFLSMSKMVASRSTCPRFQAGAIVTKNNKIISTGYNGAPSGFEHCEDVGCILRNNHCIRAIHAEQNALLLAGKEAENGTIYITGIPCPTCIKLIIQSGIKRVVCYDIYQNDDSEYWLSKIDCVKIK